MSDDGSKQSANVWPTPKFYFQVTMVGEEFSFQEASGLDVNTQTEDDRESGSVQFSKVKMPGVSKYGNVTLKRGIFVSTSAFWDWLNQIKMNTIKRETVTIKLLDQSGSASMVWTLTNAWPIKVSNSDLMSEANEIMIETLELAHEGLTVSNG